MFVSYSLIYNTAIMFGLPQERSPNAVPIPFWYLPRSRLAAVKNQSAHHKVVASLKV